MSKQYRKTKNKKLNKPSRPDSRNAAQQIAQEIFGSDSEVEHSAFEYPELGYLAVTAAYPSQEEEDDRKRAGGLSDDDKERMRSNPDSFQVNEKVVHMHHKAFGIGYIIRRIEYTDAEYRWEVKWNDSYASRMHPADFLLRRSGAKPLKEDPIEPVKHPDPNRAFREHKLRKRPFGGVEGTVFCSECEVALPGGGYGEPGDPRRWCVACFRERRGQGTAAPRPRPTTRIQERPATAKQLRIIAALGVAKGVSTAANMATLTFSGAVNIIDAWSEMSDILYGRQSRISKVQKRVITSLEGRLEMDLTPERALDLYSGKDASRLVETLQEMCDEERECL